MMKPRQPSSRPLRAALLWGFVFTSFTQACNSSGDASSPTGGSGGITGAGGTGGSGAGTGGAATGGAGTGGAGSGGNGTGGAASGGAGTGGSGTAGAATGGAALGGVGTGGSGTAGAGLGGSGTGGAGKGGAGGGSGTAGAGGSAGRGGAGGGATFEPCPTTGASCMVMPLGDSITDGVGSASPGGGYRVQLFRDAVKAGKALTFVGSATDPNGPTTVEGKMFPRSHEGHPGYTIDDSATTTGISPLVDQSIATNHPHIILLMIGTNDLDRSIDPTNAPTRLGALLDRLIKDAPNALLVVAKITPTRDDGANTGVQRYNDAITGLVQTRTGNGKHIKLVDMYAALTAQADYRTALMNDFLHPNDAGYVVMGDVWYAAIQAYLPNAR